MMSSVEVAIAHGLARVVGLNEAARSLGRSDTGLRKAFRRHGLAWRGTQAHAAQRRGERTTPARRRAIARRAARARWGRA